MKIWITPEIKLLKFIFIQKFHQIEDLKFSNKRMILSKIFDTR